MRKKVETHEKTKKTTRSSVKTNVTASAKNKQERLFGLFVSELQELLDAEQQLVKALPNVIKATDSPDLKEAFTNHWQETKEQVARLQQIFNLLDIKEKSETCEAMTGLVQECTDIISNMEKSVLRDAALISKAQCIEHYEISIYGTMRSFAKELNLDEAGDLLQMTQNEEISADKKLSKLAEGSLLSTGINRKANVEW